MNDRVVGPVAASIAAVERDTGLSKDTLRVWERRYGFPQPARDAHGERAYPLEQVEKLHLIKRLLDAGHRPGRIVSLGAEELQRIGEGLSATPQAVVPGAEADPRPYLDLVRGHDVQGLRCQLGQAALRLGLTRFVADLLAPLHAAVADARLRGQLEVFEEHLYSESVAVVLRNAIASVPEPPAQGHPRVLLTTLPQEPHALGLLMAQALLALEGCPCVSLGPQTPVRDTVLAAAACRSNLVVLSFSASLNPNQVLAGLQDLRGGLPSGVDIWATGPCPAIHRRTVSGVLALAGLEGLHGQIARWRRQQAETGRAA
jgi:hypothetical protein